MTSLVIDYALRILVVLAFGIVSLKKKLVDLTGFIAGLVVGLSVILLGGWNWFIVLLSFHLVAGVATKWKYEYKHKLGVAEEKGGARGWRNVLANGFLAMVTVLFEKIIGGQVWAYAYLASVSTAMGDTLATELGLLSPGKPRLVTRPWIRVEPGTSGGVSLLGYLATILAGVIVGLLGFLLRIIPPENGLDLFRILFITIISTIIGVTVDSILGATVQAQYRCIVCGKLTEKPVHCGRKAVLVKGFKWIDNHVVNIFGIGSGVLSALILSALLV